MVAPHIPPSQTQSLGKTQGKGKRMKRITKSLAATAIITLVLAACGTAVRDYDGPDKSDCIDLGRVENGHYACDCQFTLRDTRRVNCVVVGGGVDCDWAHADGSDNL